MNMIPDVTPPRSAFDLSHGRSTTHDAGKLIPIFWADVVPGDTWSVRTGVLSRITTLLFPIMDELITSFHYWFVPYRLVWEHWQAFCGERKTPDDTTEYLIPQVDMAGNGMLPHSNYDYFDLPLTASTNLRFNALPFRALCLIWDEWYRDQNLQDPIDAPTDDGPDPGTLYNALLNRGKRKDYISGALPWPQKGDAVTMPLGTSAPITGFVDAVANRNVLAGSQAPTYDVGNQTDISLAHNATINVTWEQQPTSGTSLATWNNPALEYNINNVPISGTADLSQATSATLALFRQSVAIQQLYEKDARGGTRYVETLRTHFGVISPDHRLQRPEWLGGGSAPLSVQPIPNTNSEATAELGTLGAYGTVAGDGIGFQHSFVEHGIIIGLMSTRAPLTYQQNLDRYWSKRDRWEFYWPLLAGIGEQAILNQEVLWLDQPGTAADEDQGVWGYSERFAEYKFMSSKVTGLMRSEVPLATSLDVWHLALDFESVRPALNADFIKDEPPVDRVVGVPTQPHFQTNMYHQVRAVRRMPLYNTPGLSRF
jgi:hypothetical protein